jgi:hypothetical protein
VKKVYDIVTTPIRLLRPRIGVDFVAVSERSTARNAVTYRRGS